MAARQKSEQESIATVVNKLYSVNPDRWNMVDIGGKERNLYKFYTMIGNTGYTVYIRFGGIYEMEESRCPIFGDVTSPSRSRAEYTTGLSIAHPGKETSVWEHGMYTHEHALELSRDNSYSIGAVYHKLKRDYYQKKAEEEKKLEQLQEKTELERKEARRKRGLAAIKKSLTSLR